VGTTFDAAPTQLGFEKVDCYDALAGAIPAVTWANVAPVLAVAAEARCTPQ